MSDNAKSIVYARQPWWQSTARKIYDLCRSEADRKVVLEILERELRQIQKNAWADNPREQRMK